jgi:Lsr2
MSIRQVLVDDLDGSTDQVHAVTFSMGADAYTIDLSPANHDRLAAALAPYIRAGRRLAKPTTARTSTAARPNRGTEQGNGREQSRQVRAWWRDNAQRLGLPPARANGAIPARVLAAYRDRATTPGTTSR